MRNIKASWMTYWESILYSGSNYSWQLTAYPLISCMGSDMLGSMNDLQKALCQVAIAAHDCIMHARALHEQPNKWKKITRHPILHLLRGCVHDCSC